MKKRLLSILVLTLIIATMLPFVGASALIGPQYVSTSNGKGLSLRYDPVKADNIIGTIPYGAKVDSCAYYNEAWSYVTYNGLEGYCMSRYLSSTKPSNKPTPKPTPSENTTISFKNFVRASYSVTVRPSTPSGFVNLRWEPSKKADIITAYYAGYTLRVLAADSIWAQVLDESTGTCGFMMLSFLSDGGDGSNATSDDSES